MTSTNDGKEVKSNQTSAPKGKSYFIDLYKSLEARLSEGAGDERTSHLCEAWRRVHTLCQHSAPSTHPHLLSWLQRHTARTVLQTEWQSPKRKDDRLNLEEAINVFIVESRTAAATRASPPPSWETQLVARGEWFKRILDNPWKHPVLNCLLNPDGTPPTNEEVLRWLTEERGVTFVMRLHALVAERCDDIAASLAGAVMQRARNTDLEPDAAVPAATDYKKVATFGDRLKEEAGFTVDVWEMLTDIEFVLLHKRDSSKCIALAKQTPLRGAYQLIERLQSRLTTSPREKRLWKNSKEVAILISQVVIARCMVIPVCAGVARSALYCCARSLARLVGEARLPAAAAALAAPAPTAYHLHTLAAAVDAQQEKETTSMKPSVCELYVRAITAGMNELERLKLNAEKNTEARAMEATLAGWFVQLGNVLASSDRIVCECALTAFSVHPSRRMYERIQRARNTNTTTHQDTEEQPSGEATNAEFGSWANDSRSQTNFVKTSETLNMKTRQKQANVLSTAILKEGEALGLSPDLCQDITVLLSGPRVKTLSWDMDRELLLENCRAYMERTHGGTKALTTELKFLNLDPSKFLHLPEEDEDENNIYYGIEKGYEHLVEFPEPEDIWQDAIKDPEKTETASSNEEYTEVTTSLQRKKKTKRIVIKSDAEEEDPLSLVAETKQTEKTEIPLGKERSKKKSIKDPLEVKDALEKKLPKEKKERKKKEKIPKALQGPPSKLIGLIVPKNKKALKPMQTVLDSHYESSSIQSLNFEGNTSQNSSQSSDSPGLTREQEFSKAIGMRITPNTAHFNKPHRPPSVTSRQTQSPSDRPRNDSPTFVAEDVKKSINKLLEYRRQKTFDAESKSSTAIRRPEVPDKEVISPKAVVIPEIPKSYINKQNDRLTELQQQVNGILAQKRNASAAIPSPVIQYASKNDSRTNKRSQTPPTQYNNEQEPSTSDRFMDSVNFVSIYDTSKPHYSQSRPFYDLPHDRPKSNQGVNYHDFLHEYHNSFKTFNVDDRLEQKKVVRPVSRVTPVIPHMNKSEKSPQSAKQLQQKKPDGSLNTFSRLSYYKNKQTDMRNQSCDRSPAVKQTVGTKLEGFILDHLLQSQDTSKNDLNEAQKPEAPQPKVRDHPTLANILQGNLQQKSESPPKNTLSEKDQHDLILLLRQQNLLNNPQASSPRTNFPVESYPPSKLQSNVNETKIPEGKTIKVVSNTVVTLADSAMTTHPKCSNPKKPKEQSKPKKTEINKKHTKKSVANPNSNESKEWQNVMNALAKHKTPCRGPNALDIALNKSSFEKAFEDSLRNPSRLFTNCNVSSAERIIRSGTDFQFRGVSITKSISTSSVQVVAPNAERKPQNIPKSSPAPPPKSLNQIKFLNPVIEKLMKHNIEITRNIPKTNHNNDTRETLKNGKPNNIGIGRRAHKGVIPKRDAKHIVETPKMLQEGPSKQYTNAVKLDSCTLGIPNSDYDLLEELMDDDLRKEIGELSSDEDSYSTAPQEFLNDSNVEKRFSVVFNECLDDATSKEKPVTSQSRTICKNETLHSFSQKSTQRRPNKQETTQTLLKPTVPKPTQNKTSVRCWNEPNIQNISAHVVTNASQAYNNANTRNKTPVGSLNEPDVQKVSTHVATNLSQAYYIANTQNKTPVRCLNEPKVSTHVVTNPSQAYNNAINQNKLLLRCLNEPNVRKLSTHVVTNPSQAYSNANIIQNNQTAVEPNMYISAVTQQAHLPNVVLIGTDLVYESYASVQRPVQSVTHIVPNTYMAVNSLPNMNMYQSTQFTPPIVSPVIIASTVSVPTVANDPRATDNRSNLISTQSAYSCVSSEIHYPTQSLAPAQVNTILNKDIEIQGGNFTCPVRSDVQKKEHNIADNDANLSKNGETKYHNENEEKNVNEKIYCKRGSSNNTQINPHADQEILNVNSEVQGSNISSPKRSDVEKKGHHIPENDVNLRKNAERKIDIEIDDKNAVDQIYSKVKTSIDKEIKTQADHQRVNVNKEVQDSNVTSSDLNDVQKERYDITDIDVNLSRNGERKVLIEVQDKNANENIYSKRRTSNGKEVKTQADQERVRKKRLAIINREINQLCGDGFVIALGYSPLRPAIKVENDECEDVTKVRNKNIIISSSQNIVQELESPATPESCENYKENKSESILVQRILLRSLSKLRNANLTSVSQNQSLDTKPQEKPFPATISTTPSENYKDDTEKHKPKRVSKRIRNKSTTNPKGTTTDNTKPGKKRIVIKNSTKNNKSHNCSRQSEKLANNQDLDTDQFFDIEAELLGSTIPKILPMNMRSLDNCSEIDQKGEIVESTVTNEKEETDSAPVEKVIQSQENKNMHINICTESAEKLDLSKAAIVSVKNVIFSNNYVEPIEDYEESPKTSVGQNTVSVDARSVIANDTDKSEKELTNDSVLSIQTAIDSEEKESEDMIKKYDDSDYTTGNPNIRLAKHRSAKKSKVLSKSEDSIQLNRDFVCLSDIVTETTPVQNNVNEDVRGKDFVGIFNNIDELVTKPIPSSRTKINNIHITDEVHNLDSPTSFIVDKGQSSQKVDNSEENLVTEDLQSPIEIDKSVKRAVECNNVQKIKQPVTEIPVSGINEIKIMDKHLICTNNNRNMELKNKVARSIVEVDDDVEIDDVIQKPLQKQMTNTSEMSTTDLGQNSINHKTVRSELSSASHMKKETRSVQNSINRKVSNQSYIKSLKNKITIKQLPSKPGDDPLKKNVLIKHINGRVLKGTVQGHLNVDSLVNYPELHSLLLAQFEQPTKRYTLKINVNQHTKGISGEVLTPYPQPISKPNTPIETVNLLSDDDEDETITPPIQTFETEYGKYRIQSIDNNLFTKHQNKLMLKSHVPLVKLSQNEEHTLKSRSSFTGLKQPLKFIENDVINIKSPNTYHICSSGILNEIKMSPVITDVDKPFYDIVNNVTPISNSKKLEEPNLVLIDNSSDDSVELRQKRKPKEKINELKNVLLRDLGVDDEILKPTDKFIGDIQNTRTSEEIDLTDSCLVMEHHSSFKDMPGDKEYYQKNIRRKCFVKLVRCDYIASKSKPVKNQHTEEKMKESEEIVDSVLPVSRSGSFSLLEHFPIVDDIEISSSESERDISSPVMEVYDVIAALEGYLLTNNNKSEQSLVSSKCHAEWMTTKMETCMLNLKFSSKSQNNEQIYNIGAVMAEDKYCQTFEVPEIVSLKCDAEWLSSKQTAHLNWRLKNKSFKQFNDVEQKHPIISLVESKLLAKNIACQTIDVPKLAAVALKYIQNEDVLNRYKLVYTRIISSPNCLKRKLESTTALPVAKITKLDHKQDQPQNVDSFPTKTLYLPTDTLNISTPDLKSVEYNTSKVKILDMNSRDIDPQFSKTVETKEKISFLNRDGYNKMLLSECGTGIEINKVHQPADTSLNKILQDCFATDTPKTSVYKILENSATANADINDALNETLSEILTGADSVHFACNKDLVNDCEANQPLNPPLNKIFQNCHIADDDTEKRIEINKETCEMSPGTNVSCAYILPAAAADTIEKSYEITIEAKLVSDITKCENVNGGGRDYAIQFDANRSPNAGVKIMLEDGPAADFIKEQVDSTSETSDEMSSEIDLFSVDTCLAPDAGVTDEQFKTTNDTSTKTVFVSVDDIPPESDADITKKQHGETSKTSDANFMSVCENIKTVKGFHNQFDNISKSLNPVFASGFTEGQIKTSSETLHQTSTRADMVPADICTVIYSDITEEKCEDTSKKTNTRSNYADYVKTCEDSVNQLDICQSLNLAVNKVLDDGVTAEFTEKLLETGSETLDETLTKSVLDPANICLVSEADITQEQSNESSEKSNKISVDSDLSLDISYRDNVTYTKEIAVNLDTNESVKSSIIGELKIEKIINDTRKSKDDKSNHNSKITEVNVVDQPKVIVEPNLAMTDSEEYIVNEINTVHKNRIIEDKICEFTIDKNVSGNHTEGVNENDPIMTTEFDSYNTLIYKQVSENIAESVDANLTNLGQNPEHIHMGLEIKTNNDSKVNLYSDSTYCDGKYFPFKSEPAFPASETLKVDITELNNDVIANANIEISINSFKQEFENKVNNENKFEKQTTSDLSAIKESPYRPCTETEEQRNSSLVITSNPSENNDMKFICTDQKLYIEPREKCIVLDKDAYIEEVLISTQFMNIDHDYATSSIVPPMSDEGDTKSFISESSCDDSINVALMEGLENCSEILEVSIVNMLSNEIVGDICFGNITTDMQDAKQIEIIRFDNTEFINQDNFDKLITENTSDVEESELIAATVSKTDLVMNKSDNVKNSKETDCPNSVKINDIKSTYIGESFNQNSTLDSLVVEKLNPEYEMNILPRNCDKKLQNASDVTVSQNKCIKYGEMKIHNNLQNVISLEQGNSNLDTCSKKSGQEFEPSQVLESCFTNCESLQNFATNGKFSTSSYYDQNINGKYIEPSAKEVTEVEIKGIEYEDPVIGTCYVFPIIEEVSELDDDSQIDEGEEINATIRKEEELHEDDNQIDENEEIGAVIPKKEDEITDNLSVFSNDPDIELIIPKQTYAHNRMLKKSLNNMKRKKDMSDFKFIPKKYRKGKNIDYPKLNVSSMTETVYVKEYKRIIDYCNSVKFSYSIPFHIECIEVGHLLNDWPIQDSHEVELKYMNHVDQLLYTDIESIHTTPVITDPLNQTLSDEIMNGNTINSYKPININETNFSMGFGERSGRVIKKLENGNTKSSAATLSDVKPHQPFSKSEVINVTRDIEKQKINMQFYMNCIILKEKVQSFFKNTAIELCNGVQGKKHDTNDGDLSEFPFGLTNTNFMFVPPTQTVVNVVQVPVSANAQNPVTCDPRVTQVSNASPSQCTEENSPGEDSQARIETEYTELTTANITLPLQEYVQHHQSPDSQERSVSPTIDDVDTTMSIVKIELVEETSQERNEESDIYENDFSPLPNNNVEYSFDDTSNTVFNNSNNVENTNVGNVTGDMFQSSTNMDNSFTSIFSSTSTDSNFTNLNNSPPNTSKHSSIMDDTTSAIDKAQNSVFSSKEVYNTNKEIASTNCSIISNLGNTTKSLDNVANIENSFSTEYKHSNGMQKENTSAETTDTSMNSAVRLENRPNNIQNTNYEYNYENMENYTNIENNNTNLDNFSTNVDSYGTNVQNYASNVNNYANVESYAGNNETFSTDVENYASNVGNYRNTASNYATNLETFSPNIDNSTSNIDNNITNIDNGSSNILEESQPQDLSLANSSQEPILRKLSTEKTQYNVTSEKRDQIAHAMNAAGITSETSDADELNNLINQSAQSDTFNTPVTANNHYSKTPVSVMTLQQALAQVLPPPLSQTGMSENNQIPNNPVTQQVLHIMQGNNAQTVINKPNGTHLLHIVQNKNIPTANGLSLVEGGLQQGNQLIHIVNNGKQNSAGQFLKRVNLLTNVANAQGSNEQKMIQFVCKSADGKSIQLNTGHPRSMVLRLHPTSVQTATKPTESQDSSASSGVINPATPTTSEETSEADVKSRTVYDENYAQFVHNPSPPSQEKSTCLPKFNQVFGKQPYSDNQNEINSNEIPEHTDGQTDENNSHIEQTAEVSAPPLLVRNPSPPETTQAQPNPVQQIKQTISPFQTMHGGVIYTRQIPVNLGGGQTINLITVPSTELVDDTGQKQQVDANFGNQEGDQPSIIKLVPHHHAVNNTNLTAEENNASAGPSNETSHIPQSQPQPQPLLTQMRIKLPMLSKGPHIVPGTRLIRPSFFQIQRNVIAGANQPVYQQLVLTAAPSLAQSIRLPAQQTQSSQPAQSPQQTQPSPLVPIAQPAQQHVNQVQTTQSQHVQQTQTNRAPASQSQSAPQTQQMQPNQNTKPNSEPDSELSTLTMEQLREFDMVLEQVKERSIVQPPLFPTCMKPIPYEPKTSADSTDSSATTTSVSESTQQVLYSVDNDSPANVVSYVNRKSTITSATTSYVRSPDSTGIVDTPTSATQVQITHTVTSKSTTADQPATAPPKKKKKKKSSSSSSALAALNNSPSKATTLKPQEDEQTTQRILYILAEYKEQVENSPDKNKPAPRRRNQFPPTTGSKRKRSHCSSRASCRREMSPVQGEPGDNGEDSLITLGSEDSSCGTTFSECTECQESHSPEDSPRKVVRRLTFEQETTTQITQTRTLPQRNVIVGDGQTITVARTTTTAKPTTTVLMPANYLLPVSMIKGGQQIAIMTNRGPKLLVGAGDTNAGALLFQRLIGPGLKPVLARPGVRHIRLPTTALHNLQTFNIQTTPATQVQPPDSTAPQPQTPGPPDLVDTRAMTSPWQDQEVQDKQEREPSPDCTEPWSMPSSSIADDYGYEEIVRTDNMERTVLDAIPDRYSPDMEAQRIFDKMFDVDSKKSMYDSPRCGYDIDASDSDDKPYHQVVQQRKDGRHHRVTHVSTAALRHKYAILEHELRLQKSLSEECEDLGVDSPSASDLFPEADILFGAPSPAHEQTIDHCNTPPPIPMTPVPRPELDDRIATDQLLTPNVSRHEDIDLNLDDVGEIVTVGEDGVATIPTINPEEFARSHPNTTFHTEPEDGEIPPFTIAQGIKGRHITFHANRVPGTVVMAPQTTVISQATIGAKDANNTVKFTDIDNMINSMPGPHPANPPSVLKEPSTAPKPLSKFDSLLQESRELTHSCNTPGIVHPAGHGAQVIRRLRYDGRNNKRHPPLEEPRPSRTISDEVKLRNDRAIVESMGDNASSPGQPELFWDSSATERHGRKFQFNESEKVTKSPFDELLNDSSAYGPHTRLDSVIKAARPERTFGRTSFEGISVSGSSDDSRPLRTYPPKRAPQQTQDMEKHFTKTMAMHHDPGRNAKTHHHELKKTLPRCQEEGRRRASGRGVVKRGCSCCNGSTTAPPKKKSRPKKLPLEFTSNI